MALFQMKNSNRGFTNLEPAINIRSAVDELVDSITILLIDQILFNSTESIGKQLNRKSLAFRGLLELTGGGNVFELRHGARIGSEWALIHSQGQVIAVGHLTSNLL